MTNFLELQDESYLYSASASREGFIEIITLGRFMVCCNGRVISDEYKRAQKMWDLFKPLSPIGKRAFRQET